MAPLDPKLPVPATKANSAVEKAPAEVQSQSEDQGSVLLTSFESRCASVIGEVDAHRLIANLGIQSSRLSRQFQKALLSLRDIQTARRERNARDLKNAAALLELHNHKGLPWQPADHGFVFSKDQVQRHSDLLTRQNEARHIAYFRFEAQSGPSGAAGAR